MEQKENVKELLLKLKALADRGIGGEKVNAEKMLAKMLTKHGLTIADLEAISHSRHWFNFHKEEDLFKQIVYSEIGSGGDMWKSRSKRGKIGIDCTHEAAILIQAKADLYIKAYQKEKVLFYRAFVMANSLYSKAPSTRTYDDLTPQEQEEYDRAQKLARGINKLNFYKQISN